MALLKLCISILFFNIKLWLHWGLDILKAVEIIVSTLHVNLDMHLLALTPLCAKMQNAYDA
jgi:hypothetical protein